MVTHNHRLPLSVTMVFFTFFNQLIQHMANNLSSVSIAAFKQQLGITKIEVVVNPHTQKLFCSTDTGMTFKCELLLDVTKPMVILVDAEDPTNLQYTLINKRESAIVKITL